LRIPVQLKMEKALPRYWNHPNNIHLNRATGCTNSKDMLTGRQDEIHAALERKLEAALNRTA
jgi:hypothetical protein